MPQTFQIKQDQWASYRRRAIRQRSIYFAILLGALVTCLAIFGAGNELKSSKQLLVVALVGITALAAMVRGIIVGIRRDRQEWTSYRLVLEENSIWRNVAGYQPLIVNRSSVTAIKEHRNGALTIHGDGGIIAVSQYLENPEQFREIISTWRPIERRRDLSPAMTWLVTLGFIPLMLIAFFSMNPRWVLPTVGACCVLLVMGFVQIFRYRKSLDKRMVRSLWLGWLPFPFLIFKLVWAINEIRK